MSENPSKIERVYNFYKDNPAATNPEISQALDIDYGVVRVYKQRLKRNGFIGITSDGDVTILRNYREDSLTDPKSFKSEVYEEMVETYLEDFRKQSTFADRLAVGREVRLILEKM